MTTLFVDNLTVIDFSYLDNQRGLLGESWIVDIELSGELDAEGVIFDFSYAKKAIKETIDTHFDHKLIVPKQSDQLNLNEQGTHTELTFRDKKNRTLWYLCPNDALSFIESRDITIEATKEAIETQLNSVLPQNITNINVHLRTEAIDGAFYHYSHGLKKHYGNCQRMAHGHRSTIEIFENGKRSAALEKEWATKWADIYIGTAEDLFAKIELDGKPYLHFSYDGNQGHFELKLSADVVDIIDTDTTVEFLAHHIANELKRKYKRSTFKVRAFEGVQKGAIAVK